MTETDAQDTAPETAPRIGRRTPIEWCREYGIVIRDAGGWRPPREKPFDEPVSLPEFYHRANQGTFEGSADAFNRMREDLVAWAQA